MESAKINPADAIDKTNASRLEWINVKSDLSQIYDETTSEKMQRKFQMNPFVPLGCALTVAALSMGLWSMKTGDRVMSQKMMRFRVGAQGFTVVALVVGVVLSSRSM